MLIILIPLLIAWVIHTCFFLKCRIDAKVKRFMAFPFIAFLVHLVLLVLVGIDQVVGIVDERFAYDEWSFPR